MSRVLLSFVGSHDPGHSAPDADGILRDGPLPSIIRHLQGDETLLDRIILFYTLEYIREDGQTQPGLEEEWQRTCERVKLLMPAAQPESVPLKINPANENEVLKVILTWLNTGPLAEGDEVHINLASGTPAIRSAWTFLIDTRLIVARAWNSLNPNMPVAAGSRVYRVGLSYMDEARHIYSASRLMKGMAFSEAGDALASISKEYVTTQRVERARWWQDLLKVYALWDRSFYSDARSHMALIQTNAIFSQLPGNLQEIIKIQGKILEALAKYDNNTTKSLPFLMDVYASLSRRFVSQQYANVGTRTRRILEGSMRYAIAQHLAMPPGASSAHARIKASAESALSNSKGMYSLVDNARKHLISFGDIPIPPQDLGWGPTSLPFIFRDTHLNQIERLYRKIDSGLNKSVEVHGFRSPDESDVRSFMTAAQSCIGIVCNGKIPAGVTNSEELLFGTKTIVYMAGEIEKWV